MFARDARAATPRARIEDLMARAARRRRARTSTGRCPATRTCSAPSRSTSATTCSPTSGCCARDRERFALRRARRSRDLPLGAGALAGVNFDTDRGMVAARARLRRRRAELDRRRLQPRLRARLPVARRRPARRTSRGSAPSSCCGRARSSASASCPTPGRSASSIMPQKKNPDAAELLRAQGAARRRPPGGAPRRACTRCR